MKTTKEELEKQALLFFALHDYERSSLNDIAKALNVTKGAIYHYFKGKDDLFRSAVLRLFDSMEEWFTVYLPKDVPFKDLLFGFFQDEAMVEEIGESVGLDIALSDYKNVLYLMLASMKKFPELKDRINGLYDGFRSGLMDLMNAAIVRGELKRDTDTEAVAYEITAFYEGALLLGAFTDKRDIHTLGPRVAASIWKRIGNEGDNPAGDERGGKTND